MPVFTSNYPFYQPGEAKLLPTSERIGALPDYTGRGVVMAFIDAGFYPHPDLGKRILIHADATTNHIIEHEGHKFSANELSWHGQMTTVIAAGDGHSSDGKYRGVAPHAALVLIKVSTPQGQVKEADILRGIRWLLDTYQRFNVRVLNISVGGDFESYDPEHPLYRAVRELTERGITVVAAAGNRGSSYMVPPASAPEAITVGGVDDRNTLDQSAWTLYHHSYGAAYDGTIKPDILAPAAWIASPILPDSAIAREAEWLAPLLDANDSAAAQQWLKEVWTDLGLANAEIDSNLQFTLQQRIHKHKLIDAHHQHVDGTSVAAAITSSVVAQMLEANSRLTPQQIRAILSASARPLPGVSRERQGAGVIDAAKAVLAAQMLP